MSKEELKTTSPFSLKHALFVKGYLDQKDDPTEINTMIVQLYENREKDSLISEIVIACPGIVFKEHVDNFTGANTFSPNIFAIHALAKKVINEKALVSGTSFWKFTFTCPTTSDQTGSAGPEASAGSNRLKRMFRSCNSSCKAFDEVYL
jgi:hypothetical protein